MAGAPLSSENAALMAYADSLQSTAQKLQSDAPAIQKQARAVQVTETSPDGLVSVTVGARGELIRLDIDPRIYRRPDSRALADTITKTIHDAGEAAQDRVLELFDPLIPRNQMKMYMDGDTEGVVESMTQQIFGKER